MSEATATSRGVDPQRGRPAPPRPAGRSCDRCSWWSLLVVLLALPLYVEEFWLRTGFAVFGAIVGAIGLNLLVGTTGQLSLAHAFFLACGAVTYVFVSGESGGIGLADLSGLGLAAAGRHDRRRAGGRPRRPAVQPDRGPAAGHLPGCRLARPGLHRPARPQQLDVGDRRLQRAVGTGVLAVRLHLRQHATPSSSSSVCRSARPSGSGTSGWSSPSPPTCSPGTCCAAARAGRCRPCATARSPRRSWASTSSATRRASSSSARCTPGSPG